MTLIRCENLSFAYDGQRVLQDVNFQIEPGDYLAILGENGSGKSTLLKGILGLKAPATGRVTFASGLTPSKLGYLPQKSEIQKDFPATVEEIVLSGAQNRQGLRPFYSKADKALARKRMDKLELSPLAKRSFRELSGGQQQRVLLARALVAGRDLLILDEPFAGLDPLVSQDLYRQLADAQHEGMAIIMVSHDLHASLHHANKVLHLGSRQLFFGSVEDYRQSAIGQSYLGLSRQIPQEGPVGQAEAFDVCEVCAAHEPRERR